VKDPNNKNNNRKKFACPFCPHRSSRKWNMQVHINRWHKNKDNNKGPLYLGDQIEALLKSKIKNNEHSPSAPKKPESLFEPINEFHRLFVEAKDAQSKIREITSFRGNPSLSNPPRVHVDDNMANFAPPDSGSPPRPHPPIPHPPIPSFHANTLLPSFSYDSPATDSRGPRKEKISGFMSWICDYCTKIVIETYYAVGRAEKTCR
jgi:hypothetical protein